MTVGTTTGKAAGEPAKRPMRADAIRNRQKLLDAASELFATRGLDITLDDVAAHAGVGVGTVYRRFKDKRELIDGVFEQRFEDIYTTARKAIAAPDGWQGFVEFFEKLCEGMSLDRGLGEVVLGSDDEYAAIACSKERIGPLVEQIVTRAHESGQLRPDVAYQDVFVLLEMIAAGAEFSCATAPDNWRRYFAVVFDGLRSKGVEVDGLPGRPPTEDEIYTAKQSIQRRRR